MSRAPRPSARVRRSRRTPLAGALVVVAAVVLAACAGSSSDGGSATTTTAAGTGSTSAPKATSVNAAPAGKQATGPAVPSSGCGKGSGGAVSLDKQFLDDSDRWYLLTTPSQDDGKTPLPLVLDIHGLLEGAVIQAKMSQLSASADQHGFVLATPQGSGTPLHWDVKPDLKANPDLEYMTALLDQVEAEQCIDTSRVYATGLSNGAFMSSILACTMADRFAAVAPVSGVIRPTTCDPSRPVPLLAFHGEADPILLFNGGVGAKLGNLMKGDLTTPTPIPKSDLNGKGYPATTQVWATKNGCTGKPIDKDLTKTVILRTWDCPADGVVQFVVLKDGGHSWPGSKASQAAGDAMGFTNMTIDANDLIWSFFQRFQLPPS